VVRRGAPGRGLRLCRARRPRARGEVVCARRERVPGQPVRGARAPAGTSPRRERPGRSSTPCARGGRLERRSLRVALARGGGGGRQGGRSRRSTARSSSRRTRPPSRASADSARTLASLGKSDEAMREQEGRLDHALQAAAVAALQAGKAQDARRSAEELLSASRERVQERRVRGRRRGGTPREGLRDGAEELPVALEGEKDAAKRMRRRSRIAWCRYLGGDAAGAAKAFANLAREAATRRRRAPLRRKAPRPRSRKRSSYGRSLEAASDLEGAGRAYPSTVSRFARGPHAEEAAFRPRSSTGPRTARCASWRTSAISEGDFAGEALRARRAPRGREKPDEAATHYRALLESNENAALAPAARYGLAGASTSRASAAAKPSADGSTTTRRPEAARVRPRAPRVERSQERAARRRRARLAGVPRRIRRRPRLLRAARWRSTRSRSRADRRRDRRPRRARRAKELRRRSFLRICPLRRAPRPRRKRVDDADHELEAPRARSLDAAVAEAAFLSARRASSRATRRAPSPSTSTPRRTPRTPRATARSTRPASRSSRPTTPPRPRRASRRS
jgi:hypothetical protein